MSRLLFEYAKGLVYIQMLSCYSEWLHARLFHPIFHHHPTSTTLTFHPTQLHLSDNSHVHSSQLVIFKIKSNDKAMLTTKNIEYSLHHGSPITQFKAPLEQTQITCFISHSSAHDSDRKKMQQ